MSYKHKSKLPRTNDFLLFPKIKSRSYRLPHHNNITHFRMKKLYKNFFAAQIIAAALLLLFFGSCQKEDTSDFVSTAEVASQHLKADLDINHFFSIIHTALYDTALNNSNTSAIDSAVVTRTFDTLAGKTVYTFDYADGTISPDFKEKSGTFQAFLDSDFNEVGTQMEVLIHDFKINARTLQGTIYFTLMDENHYKLSSTIVFSGENQPLITYHGDKEILWTEGMANPLKPSEQKFTLAGNAKSNYVDAYNKALPIAEIISETDGVWNISFSCHKLVNNGALNITVIIPEGNNKITGQFQDADIDGCSDKVMLKNNEGFGYPYYI